MHKTVYSLTGIVALAIAAQAQTSRGTVSGTVMDASGAVVPGAGVLVVGTETGARRSTLTNEAGIYRFDAVDLGVYEIKITHPGFNAFVSTGLRVEANRTSVIDARFEVGSGETAVRVSAEAETAMVRDAPL